VVDWHKLGIAIAAPRNALTGHIEHITVFLLMVVSEGVLLFAKGTHSLKSRKE